jgi:hypothetical protein
MMTLWKQKESNDECWRANDDFIELTSGVQINVGVGVDSEIFSR